jgi:hypothetical protein
MDECFDAAWFQIEYSIPDKLSNIDSFTMELQHDDYTAQIKSLTFMTCNTQVAKYSSFDISKIFNTSGQIADISYETLSIKSENEEIYLYGTDMFINEYNTYYGLYWRAIANCAFWAVIFFILCLMLEYLVLKKKDKIKLSFEDWVLAIGLVTIFITAVLIAMFSQNYAHNDEQLFRMAIDYFLGQWRYPNASSSWMAGTWSLYGANRLTEYTFYYLLAGKVGWFFKQFFGFKRYYRMLNIICLGIMLGLCWTKRRTHKWMSVIIALTPKTWYIFSYACSDAWDLFWCFIIIYMLISVHGILYKAIAVEEKPKHIVTFIYIILCSFVFAQILLGKSNFMIVLGVAFIDLLIYWLKNKEKLKRLVRYILIVALTFLIVYAKKNEPKISDTYYSNENIKTILTEQVIERVNSSSAFFSSEELMATNKSLNPSEQGQSFMYMLMESGYMPTIPLIYITSIGFYRWERVYAGTLNSILIMLLQISMMCIYIKYLLKDKRIENIAQTVTSSLLIIVLFVIQLVYCYYATYSPQGRYMLPAYFVIGYMCARNSKVLESRGFLICKYLCMYVGIYSFLFVGCGDLLNYY